MLENPAVLSFVVGVFIGYMCAVLMCIVAVIAFGSILTSEEASNGS